MLANPLYQEIKNAQDTLDTLRATHSQDKRSVEQSNTEITKLKS